MSLMLVGGLCAPTTKDKSKLSFDEWADMYDFMRASGVRQAPSQTNKKLEEAFNAQPQAFSDALGQQNALATGQALPPQDGGYDGGVNLPDLPPPSDDDNAVTGYIEVDLVATPNPPAPPPPPPPPPTITVLPVVVRPPQVDQLYQVLTKVMTGLFQDLRNRAKELEKAKEALSERSKKKNSSPIGQSEDVKIRINVEPPLKFASVQLPITKANKTITIEGKRSDSLDASSETRDAAWEARTTPGDPTAATREVSSTAAQVDDSKIDESIKDYLRRVLDGLSRSEEKAARSADGGNKVLGRDEKFASTTASENPETRNSTGVAHEKTASKETDGASREEEETLPPSHDEKIKKFVNGLWRSFVRARKGTRRKPKDDDMWQQISS